MPADRDRLVATMRGDNWEWREHTARFELYGYGWRKREPPASRVTGRPSKVEQLARESKLSPAAVKRHLWGLLVEGEADATSDVHGELWYFLTAPLSA